MLTDLRLLHGEWFIHFSDFPMWLKGDKTGPSITYGEDDRPQCVGDVVSYMKRGRKRFIRGADQHLGEGRFRWRGAGLLGFVTSDWKIDYLSEDGMWMIISFEKSHFTPAGNDILCRRETIHDELAGRMMAKFRMLRPRRTLHRLPRMIDAS